jgi:hypothetical protein
VSRVPGCGRMRTTAMHGPPRRPDGPLQCRWFRAPECRPGSGEDDGPGRSRRAWYGKPKRASRRLPSSTAVLASSKRPARMTWRRWRRNKQALIRTSRPSWPSGKRSNRSWPSWAKSKRPSSWPEVALEDLLRLNSVWAHTGLFRLCPADFIRADRRCQWRAGVVAAR